MFSISTQVLIVKALLSVFIIAVSLTTLWYCLAVFYDVEFQVGRPLACVSRQLSAGDDVFHNFWLDKLALLAAKRTGTTVFWDDAIDISLLPTKEHVRDDLETVLRRVGDKCDMELSQSSSSNSVWTLTTLAKPQLLGGSESVLSFLMPKLMHLPGAFVFKVHIRSCQRKNVIISCPSYFHDENNGNDILAYQDVFPINKENCIIAGAETQCPNNVENILKQEFGETWKSEMLLNFKKRERKL